MTVGYASQINLLVSRGSAADLSPVFTALGFLAFGSWVVAGWLFTPRNYAIVVPNALGAICSSALLILWFIFR